MTMALRSLIFVLIEIDLLLSRDCNFANADVAMASPYIYIILMK